MKVINLGNADEVIDLEDEEISKMTEDRINEQLRKLKERKKKIAEEKERRP